MQVNFQNLCQQLSAIYEEREAQNIVQLLFEDLLGIKNNFANYALNEAESQLLEQALQQLLERKPVQYITGNAHFYGYDFQVNPAVLIPRPETEELVYRALSVTKTMSNQPIQVLDIGTGSGCIPITLKKENPALQITAIDISQEALIVARANAFQLQAEVHFKVLNFTDKRTWNELGTYDLILSNPPYIPWQEKDLVGPNVLGKEPDLALFVADEDPLLFYRLIAEFALDYLKESGVILVETNQYNAPDVLALFQAKGFGTAYLFQDLMGNDRIVLARKASEITE